MSEHADHEMLSGRRPFEGESRLSTMSAILKEEPKPLENVPSELDKIIRRCLRKDRDKRYQHMDDLKLALDEVIEDSASGNTGSAVLAPPRSNKLRWMAVGAVIAVAAAAGMWFLRPKALETRPAEIHLPNLALPNPRSTVPTRVLHLLATGAFAFN